MAGTKRISCGLDFTAAPNLQESLDIARESRFEFVSIPLVHSQFRREFISGTAKDRLGPFTRSDLILPSTDWQTLIVGKLSPHINVDSKVSNVRVNSEAELLQELSLASHLGVPAITFKLKNTVDKNVNLARIINNKLVTVSNLQFWVQIPLDNPKKQASSYRRNEEVDCESTWEWWNGFRSMCEFDKKLGVALELTHDLPDNTEIERWSGEPVKCLILPTTIFISNKNGYPVLSRAHQALIHNFSSLNVQFLLTGAHRYENKSLYHSYISHIWKKSYNSVKEIESYSRGYEDYLQIPLQPLMDNLESGTYEVFEQDPVKYNSYQDAIHAAILSKKKNQFISDAKKEKFVITIVGAGRGPLIRAAINAANAAGVDYKIYAVEKNINAVQTLHALKSAIFGDKITIVSSDMRQWEAPEKADILVSELLGSFGDNELSPECLDGAQKCLKDGGISIPKSYTSYVAPIQSTRIYNELKVFFDKDKPSMNNSQFETPYVVYLHNKYDIDDEQPLFTFVHPNKDPVIDNSRYGVRVFTAKQSAVLNGFAGYFDVILYDKITLSIIPKTHSPGMVSWYPIFFPIKQPVQVKAGDKIELHFWRRCGLKNVWYEWSLNKPQYLGVHNPNGRSYTIGLFN